MSKEHLERVQRAITKYATKQTIVTKDTRKNKKPEKEVEKSVLKWCRSLGWQMTVVEAKATWDKQTGCYRSQAVAPGFPDAVGCFPNGLFVALEFKAPGKRATLKEHQRDFLEDKIKAGCFCVCTDGIPHLKQIYLKWFELRKLSVSQAKQYLLDAMPKKKKKLDDSELF